MKYPLPEEEIAYGPSTWLWDYLRRSRTGGFFLPLSGGADSSSVATMVHIMCTRVVSEIKAGNAEVLRDLRTIVGEPNFTPQTSKEVASKIFYTSCTASLLNLCIGSAELRLTYVSYSRRHGLDQLI